MIRAVINGVALGLRIAVPFACAATIGALLALCGTGALSFP